MFFLCLLFRYLFSAGTVHRKINGILQTRPAKILAVKIQHIFGPKAPDVFSWLTFFDTCFRPQQAIEKNNGILQTRPAKIQAVKIQYILGPKAPDVFSWLTFFDTCFRLEQAIEKSTEFCKQDLPRFWQLKYNIFLGPRPQMFFLCLLFRYLFSAGTVHRKINGILQTRPAKILAVKIQHIFGPKAPDVFSWLTFFDTCFRPRFGQQAQGSMVFLEKQSIEKSTEFYKQDLPRPQMFFLGLLFGYLFSAGTGHRKVNGILHTSPATIQAVKIQYSWAQGSRCFFLAYFLSILVFGWNRP